MMFNTFQKFRNAINELKGKEKGSKLSSALRLIFELKYESGDHIWKQDLEMDCSMI